MKMELVCKYFSFLLGTLTKDIRLAGLVKNKGKNVQLLYQTIYCLWLLSYNGNIAEGMNDTRVIPNLVEILKTATKEKVIRMSLATLRVSTYFSCCFLWILF